MNRILRELYKKDQSDRMEISSDTITWDIVKENDVKRMNIVMNLYHQNELKTGSDYYHAAMILQHGVDTKDYQLANEFCKRAIKKGNRYALWLYAATYDRILTSQKAKYQKYGTQYWRDSLESPYYLYPVDPKTTDFERKKYNVPSLSEQVKKLEELNKKK